MAQVDVQWPSEDEDFDATTNKVGGVPTFDEDDEADLKSESVATSEASVEPPKTESEPVEQGSEPEESESEPESTEEQVPDPAPEPEHEAPAAVPVAPAAQSSPKPPKAKKGSIGRTIVEVVLVAALIGLGLWAWNLSSDNKNLKQQVSQLNANPQIAVQKQTQSLIDNVAKLMQLPTGETPTVASVSDASQAKQQSAFFNNAQNGDKVLMYVKAGEAILYRPSTNKIILVAPLTFTGSSTTGASSSSTSSKSTTTTPKTTTTTP
jgi:cell division protein FtsB